MENTNSHMESLKRGQRVALTATIAIFLLAVAKFFTGYLFDSRILIADAFHSGVDVLAIFASWFGLWLASRKESTRFPYGLYKAETFVTLLVGVLVVWAGFENFVAGYGKLFLPAPHHAFPTLPVLVSGISVFVSYFVARMEKETGVFINSGALQANASEAFLDIGTSLVVLTGILLAHAKIPYIEGSIVMLIALLIIRLGAKNIWTPLLILMDANLDPELQSEIEEKISSVNGVKGVRDVKIRQSGPFKMVECDIATGPSVSVYKAHELADKIEDLIASDYNQIESVFVHVEPAKQDTLSVIIPVKEINGLDSTIHGHFGRAPYFIILKLDDKGGAEIEDFYYNEFLGEKDRIHIGVKVIKAVIKHNLDIVFTPKIGEIAFYMLKDNFIDIYRAEAGATVRKIIEQYHNGEMEPIVEPHPAEESEIERQKADSL
ncbi:MAG: cation diffusion facilitator family transporter [Proteobacteria bacterium]|nr:cation diffusion facilitator family transporter [Pseudomonadota bacterium]